MCQVHDFRWRFSADQNSLNGKCRVCGFETSKARQGGPEEKEAAVRAWIEVGLEFNFLDEETAEEELRTHGLEHLLEELIRQ